MEDRRLEVMETSQQRDVLRCKSVADCKENFRGHLNMGILASRFASRGSNKLSLTKVPEDS